MTTTYHVSCNREYLEHLARKNPSEVGPFTTVDDALAAIDREFPPGVDVYVFDRACDKRDDRGHCSGHEVFD